MSWSRSHWAEILVYFAGTPRCLCIWSRPWHQVLLWILQITLWGSYSSTPGDQLEIDAPNNPILVVKNARIGEFNGKTLSTISHSVVEVNPDLPEAGALRHWCVP